MNTPRSWCKVRNGGRGIRHHVTVICAQNCEVLTTEFYGCRNSAIIDGMRVTPRRLAVGMSLWIPNLFSGIRVKGFADDWTSAVVELHINVFTRNYVKTAFGGSMSAMTDPYYFMLVMHQLGRDYVVWDTRGEIEFVKPGRGVLTARFEVPRDKAEELRERARGGAKVLEWFETDITDSSGEVVARVRREVYVRQKRRVTQDGAS